MTRDLPRAISGAPRDNANKASISRLACGFLSCALALSFGFITTLPANADELDDKKEKLSSQIKQSNADIKQYKSNVATAEKELASSKDDLAYAQSVLSSAIEERQIAEIDLVTAKYELAEATVTLMTTNNQVYLTSLGLEEQRVLVGQNARVTMQQQSPLVAVGILVKPSSTVDMASQLQWSDQVFNSTQNQIDILSELEIQFEVSKQAADEASAEVAKKKKAADETLAAARDSEAAAVAAEAEVARLVDANKAAEATAKSILADEEERNRQLKKESAEVDARIAERIRKQKEAEERARKAAEAEAARKAAEAEAARKSAASKSSSSSSSSSGSSSSSSSSGLLLPVQGPITSPYGMRFHPILKYWKMHDGTDFGASCGTPIRAAADGVVTDRYYNAGYGNRLMIDHGKINGSYLTTGYNHATHYIVGVGQRVSKGQVVGYIGSTGYSTGCHLHLMVWENGTVVNPMRWF